MKDLQRSQKLFLFVFVDFINLLRNNWKQEEIMKNKWDKDKITYIITWDCQFIIPGYRCIEDKPLKMKIGFTSVQIAQKYLDLLRSNSDVKNPLFTRIQGGSNG